MVNKFLTKVNIKKGALSRQLGIPVRNNIPLTLLNKIIRSKAGDKINNPTKSGKKVIKVTKLLKKRSTFARTLKRFNKNG